MNFKDIHGNIPDNLKRVDNCIYLESDNICSHKMNHGECDDHELCMVSVYRKLAGQENIKPCGLLTGESCNHSSSYNADFAGCGHPYCIHFKTENWRGRK